jgi:hypothetical protein
MSDLENSEVDESTIEAYTKEYISWWRERWKSKLMVRFNFNLRIVNALLDAAEKWEPIDKSLPDEEQSVEYVRQVNKAMPYIDKVITESTNKKVAYIPDLQLRELRYQVAMMVSGLQKIIASAEDALRYQIHHKGSLPDHDRTLGTGEFSLYTELKV